MKDQIKDKICFALDVGSKEEALYFVDLLKDYVGFFKVGMQLFTKEGPDVVRSIINKGGKVFLDLKYHDIPNTVASTSKVVMDLGVSMFNVHAMGCCDMLEATVTKVKETADKLNVERPLIIAVTVLTSIDEITLKKQLEIKCEGGLEEYVMNLAKLAYESDLDGIVCSPQETRKIKENFGDDFFVINPGIRPVNSNIKRKDQKRHTTHIEAIKNGADLLVIGRPIRESNNPLGAAQSIFGGLEVYYNRGF